MASRVNWFPPIFEKFERFENFFFSIKNWWGSVNFNPNSQHAEATFRNQ